MWNLHLVHIKPAAIAEAVRLQLNGKSGDELSKCGLRAALVTREAEEEELAPAAAAAFAAQAAAAQTTEDDFARVVGELTRKVADLERAPPRRTSTGGGSAGAGGRGGGGRGEKKCFLCGQPGHLEGLPAPPLPRTRAGRGSPGKPRYSAPSGV